MNQMPRSVKTGAPPSPQSVRVPRSENHMAVQTSCVFSVRARQAVEFWPQRPSPPSMRVEAASPTQPWSRQAWFASAWEAYG